MVPSRSPVDAEEVRVDQALAARVRDQDLVPDLDIVHRADASRAHWADATRHGCSVWCWTFRRSIGLDRLRMGPCRLNMAETYLTVAEIAELLKLNPQTIRNWIFSPGVCVFPDAVGLRRR
jgi:hypothetical protein